MIGGTAVRSIMAVGLALSAPLALAQRGPGTTDAFGYQVSFAPSAQCAAQFVDIAATGTTLSPTAAGGSAALDDGGALVALSAPFPFYGRTLTSLVASTNGYLASAASLADEDGGDFSNDCPAPAVPDNAAASGSRILAFHDELDGTVAGSMQQQFFATCPRPVDGGAAQACTIVQWTAWGRHQGTGSSTFQAVLYHDSGGIALQYSAVDDSAGASATVGAQDVDAQSAAVAACNGSATLAAGMAICLAAPAAADALFANGFED